MNITLASRIHGAAPLGRRRNTGRSYLKNLLLAVGILAAFAGPGLALTLEEAVLRALEANPQLEAALYDWQAARTGKSQVTSLPDPALEFTLGSSGPDAEGELRTIAVAQALPFPSKILKSRSRAGAVELAAGARYEHAKRKLTADVKRAYVDLAVIDAKTAIYEEDLSDALVLVEAIRRRYEVGRAGQHDLVKAQVEALLIENRLEILRSDTRTAAAERLRALLRLERSGQIGSLVMPLLDLARVDTAAIRKTGVGSSPELQSRGHMVEAARMDVGLARMQWIPDLKLKFFLDERDMAMGRNKARGLMLSANLPLWGWKTRASVGEKNASLARRRSELAAARDASVAELETDLASVTAKMASYDLFGESLIPQAELAHISARTAYETGKTDILSLVAAQRTLREARLTRLDLWAGMAHKLAEIEMLTGLEFY